MSTKKKLVVPIVFDAFHYYTEKPLLSWVFEMYSNYCVNNNTPLIAQENYFNQEINALNETYEKPNENITEKKKLNKEIQKFKKYSITNEETLSISGGKRATLKDQINFISNTNTNYIEFINNKLDKIEEDYSQKADAILTWYWNPSLASIAKKRNLHLITQELSSIRKVNYRMTLSYFSFTDKFDNDYCLKLFHEFKKERNKSLKILSREELLALLLYTEDLKLIKELQKPPVYELGISPPFENDFFYEIHKNESLNQTITTINNMFTPNEVTIRHRIEPYREIGHPDWYLDKSPRATYWISKCKRILTYVSNIAFDAMLLGKTVYLLSDNMPFSFRSINHFQYKDESIVDTEYLNFMIFGYFVPWDLMLNQEYIEWRLTNPAIIDIYKKHQNYIFDKVGIDNTKDISLREILKTTHGLEEKEINDIEKYSGYEYVKSLKAKNRDLKEQIARNKLVIEEFKAFKQGFIWKFLVIWRKFKKYFKNFFINIKNDGVITTFKRMPIKIRSVIEYRKRIRREKDPYKYWIKNNKIDLKRRNKIKKELRKLKYHPLISIVMPVYNVDLKWIKKAVKSIKNQIYTNWELCIADDASTNPKLRKYLERISKQKRIKVVFREKNGHISEATNSALELAEGEFVALMDNDDYIYPHALAEVVKVLNEKPETDFIYSDEDKLEMTGERVNPFFKPDWSPDLFMSTNYLCHFTIARKEMIDAVGGFRKGYEGAQDYDLFLRIIEKTQNIEHIPDILYSWRKIPGSTASEYADKNYAETNTIKALKDSLKRRKVKGEVSVGLFPGSFRVKYDIVNNPLVSIIIPTKDKRGYIERCISSILSKTTYNNYEIIIVDTGSTEKDTLDYYETIKKNPEIKFVYWKKPFNYSTVNNFGVKHAKGEYILLLNNDTEVITDNWIEGMLEHAQREEVGAVGVKLLYPDNRIQHAGVLLGINGGTGRGVAGHAFKFFPREIQGFPVQKDIIRNYSAVTAACLMVKKEKFNEVKGLNKDFRIAFNDVDFCLKLREKGYVNVYTPYTELYHHESISVGTPESKTRDVEGFAHEINLMYQKWGNSLLHDPFYNKNLTLKKEDFSLVIDS
jgi:GT2 family glycosyltransferase